MKTFRKWQELQAEAVATDAQMATDAPADPRQMGQDLKANVQKMAVKLGEKANKYLPLIRYCSRNPQMIQLLDQLIVDAAGMQASTGNRLFAGKPQQ